MNDIADIILRQQVYVEAVKNEEAGQIDPYLEMIAAALAAVLAKYKFDKLSDLTKRQLNLLLTTFVRRINRVMEQVKSGTSKRLLAFMKAEIDVTRYVMSEATGKPTKAPYDSSADGNRTLWQRMTNGIIPANGETLLGMFGLYARNAKDNARAFLRREYANGGDAQGIMSRFLGTAANKFKDGALHKLRVQYSTLIRTGMQYIINNVQHGLGSIFYDKYRWVSIIDAVTTDFCRAHNNLIFTYGMGPIPPAHYNCRSSIVPVANEKSNYAPGNFGEWVMTQDASFQDYVFGRKDARSIRKNGLTQPGDYRLVNKRKTSASDYRKQKRTIFGRKDT